MKKNILILLSGLWLAGCTTTTAPVRPLPVAPNGSRLDALTGLPITRTVGTGSGDLTIDGKVLGILPGETVTIYPGTYSSLTVANLNGLPALPVTVLVGGLVEVVGGGVVLQNVSYLTLDGGTTAKNLFLHDVAYRGIVITGSIPHALTIQGLRAKNIGDYALLYDNETTYKGLDATAFTDFKLLSCDFDNTGTIEFRGELNQSAELVNTGFMKNPEVANCNFKNSATAGTILYFGNAESMNIHNNVVNNVNTQNNNHNGIFHLRGNGNIHHNKCTNHQGNFIRFWPFSQGIFPREVLIHDNIVWNSRKYSAFEVQSFAENMIPLVSTYCHAKVYNNTVGRMNTALPTVFVGVVVDVYNLFGGDVQIFNNLSFEQVRTPGNDGIWSQQNVTSPSVYTNNQYFGSAADAGLTDTVFFRLLPTSPAKAAGVYRLYETDDYYGTQRSNPLSLGAVD